MDVLSAILVVFVGLFHIQVFVLESLLWKSPRAQKAFDTTPQTAEIMYPLAVSQGVYNLFLSAGLFLSFLLDDPFQFQAQLFFLSCVVVAATVVGITVSKKIMLIQGLPALLGLIFVILAH